MTYSQKKILGSLGEWLAKRIYLDRGCILLAQNVRTRYSEIDLIFQKQNYLYFVEVKLSTSSRKSFHTWIRNQAKLLYLSSQLYQSSRFPDSFFQIDYIEFNFSKSQVVSVDHYKAIQVHSSKNKMI
jgi:Holliday junction resolvase-like predicted endonuclease